MRERERESDSERESISIMSESERQPESERLLFPSNAKPQFPEVHAELSRNFRNRLRYNPEFAASATHLLEPEASSQMSVRTFWTWVQLTAILRKKTY